MKRQYKRILLLLLGIVLFGASLVAALVYHYAQPRQVTVMLVDFTREQLQLQLRFTGEPGYAFWPGLSLRLAEPRLSLAGQDRPMLTARRLGVDLPWSSLRTPQLVIERIEMDGAELDLNQVDAWIAQSTDRGELPDAQARLRIDDGVLRRGDTTLASGIVIDGQIGLREAAAWWSHLHDATSPDQLLPPVHGRASAESINMAPMSIEGVHVDSDPP